VPSGAPVGLPGYAFNVKANRYIRVATGKFVKRSAITDLLTSVTSGTGNRLERLALAAQRGDLTGRQFYELARREIKQATNASTALGRGGWDRVTQADYGRTGAQLKKEYARLGDFAGALERGEVSELQAASRARLYSDSSFKRYWEIDRDGKIQRGEKHERWIVVRDDRTCQQCLGLAAQGCVEVGVLPLPGVHLGCRCRIEGCKPPSGKSWDVASFRELVGEVCKKMI